MGGDDFAWAATPPPAETTSESRPVTLSASMRSLLSRGGARVQIEMDGGWKDLLPDDHKQVCDSLVAGETMFSISARGQMYAVDFTRLDNASQTNQATGKRR